MLGALFDTASQKALATDPKTLAKLSRLEGKNVALDILKLNKSVFLCVEAETMNIVFEEPETVDVRLIAKPSTLLKIARDGMEDAKLEAGELVIEGDAIVGQRFAGMMNELDIDWEELFSGMIGDVPARALFSFLQKANEMRTDSKARLKSNVRDYLVEESQLIAHQGDVEEFVDNVDKIRNDASRLEARLNLLLTRNI